MARQPAKVLRSPRFVSRRRDVRKERQRRRRRVTISVVALGSLALGGWILARSSLFALEGIEVAGAKSMSRNEIVRASGLRPGANMLSLDLDTIEARVGRLPLVRTVEVSKPTPSKVRIAVTERVASFVLETVEGRWFLDDEATVLGPSAGIDPVALPTLRLTSRDTAEAGDRIFSPDLGSALALWDALPDGLRTGAPVIEAAAAGLTLHRTGLTIRFGPMDRIDDKLEAVSLVLARARAARERLIAIDVRSPARPAAIAA
jgi:cell division protein FtsQ